MGESSDRPEFTQVYERLKVAGPAHVVSSRGTDYEVAATAQRDGRPLIIGRLRAGAQVRIHEDCWGQALTCQQTRAGGIYNGSPSIYDWYWQATGDGPGPSRSSSAATSLAEDAGPSGVLLGRPSRAMPGAGRGIGTVADIEANLVAYLEDRAPTDRYVSFDYCYNHFQSYWEQGRVQALADEASLQLSCLHLGFYLASWGMLRGSTTLLQRSLRYLAPVIETIAAAPPEIWSTDANDYSDENCSALVGFAQRLRQAFPEGASDTLATKIMLGVFGCVPAFDNNFVTGSGLSFSSGALKEIARFYRENSPVVERYRVPTLDFDTLRPTSRTYSRAKVVDMIFFVEGARKIARDRAS